MLIENIFNRGWSVYYVKFLKYENQILKTLTAAYTAIINDDKIYFSGGAFEAPRQFIKKLNIIGAGAKIDGSMATGYTKIFAMGTEVKINTGYPILSVLLWRQC